MNNKIIDSLNPKNLIDRELHYKICKKVSNNDISYKIINMTILTIFFFITAILYSSVGFGGGSTYLALMLIWDIPYYIFPIIALFCNIIVVSGNSINFIRSGNINLKLVLPYLVGSVPFAFFGASLSIDKDLFEIILFLILVIAGFFLLIESRFLIKKILKLIKFRISFLFQLVL